MRPRLHSPRETSIDRNGCRLLRLKSDGMGKIQPNAKRILAVLATGVFLTLAGHAQRTDAALPNAPAPTTVHFPSSQAGPVTPVLTASLRRSDTPDAATAASTTGDVSLYTVVDLALRNSRTVRMAEANKQRARAVVLELHDAYIPNFTVGSGIGPPNIGFPLGTPNIFNASSQSLIFSFSQSDYIRSARAALKAADFSLQDARRQVILDTASSFLELSTTDLQLAALQQAMDAADQLVSIVKERVAAGIDSRVAETRARLTRAEMKVQQIQLQDRAGELRNHISNLMGLPADSIVIDSNSIPAMPNLDISTPIPNTQPPAVQAAFATADSRSFMAHGDELQNYRPNIQQLAQYSLFSTFENYQQYYNAYQANNFGFEIQVVWPLFDPVRRAKAAESSAAAARARSQADQTKFQFAENNLALWHRLDELKAQQQVAELKQELAKDTLDSLLTQMKSGNGSPNAPAITPEQAQQSRIDERTSYIDMLNADFDTEHVQLELLSALGGLEDWAKQSVQPQGVPGAALTPASPH